MSYKRVMPRDLFNEANLLKCMGQLALHLHDKPMPGIKLFDMTDGGPYDIEQNFADGSISVSNLRLYVEKCGWVPVYRPLNSRSEWPLYAEFEIINDVAVFDSEGQFSKEFLDALAGVYAND